MSDPFFDEVFSHSPGGSRQSTSRIASATQPVPLPPSDLDEPIADGTDPLSRPAVPRAAPVAAPARAALPTSATPSSGNSLMEGASNSGAVSDTVQHYALFKVDVPVQGTELLKPLTYFPISVTVNLATHSNTAVTRMVPLPLPPHHRKSGAVAGQRRNRWEGDAGTEIRRRYSELVDLRALLVLQYPMLVIPPLAAKSTTDSFDTYMQSQAQLRQQMRNISRFLRELGKMPEVMLFNDYVPNFFQYPREKFYEWMSRIREAISLLRSANASLEEHRPKRKKAAANPNGESSTLDTVEDTVSSIAVESTKLVRGFMGAISNWVSSPASGSAAAATKNRESLQAQAEVKFAEHMQVQFWNDRILRAEEQRLAILDTADVLKKLIVAEDDAYQALFDIGDSVEQFAALLNESEPFHDLQVAVARSGSLIKDIADTHSRDGGKCYTQVYELLLFEASYLEAMVDAMEFVKCLWRRHIENSLDSFMKPGDVSEFRSYVAFVDDRLKSEVLLCSVRHSARMKSILKKCCDIPLASFREEEKKTSVHPFVILSRTAQYSVFE